MRPVLCYAYTMRLSRLIATLRGTAGLGIIEVLAVTVIVGIAVIGVALMFGKGSAWVAATGADRVAAGLAQQRIEQIRACGWNVATADPNDPDALSCPGEIPNAPALRTGLGVLLKDPVITAANNLTFMREVCIQYVDDTTAKGLQEPPFTVAGDCPPGDPAWRMVRITVVVSSTQPEVSRVVLQAWMSRPVA